MPISEYLKKLRERVGSAPVMITAVSALVFDDVGFSFRRGLGIKLLQFCRGDSRVDIG